MTHWIVPPNWRDVPPPNCTAPVRDKWHMFSEQLKRLLWAEPPETVETDPVNHPAHYTGHASGVECIQITEHMNFCRGNAIKYIWRAGDKGNEVQDLEKAVWYLQREIARLKSAVDGVSSL